MPVLWSPDTCKCQILYDQKNMIVLESYANPNGKVRKTIKCPDHAELDTKTELLQFVTPENQSANEIYKDWTQKEIEENSNFISEYKREFSKKVMIPIRGKNPINAKIAFEGIRSGIGSDIKKRS